MSSSAIQLGPFPDGKDQARNHTLDARRRFTAASIISGLLLLLCLLILLHSTDRIGSFIREHQKEEFHVSFRTNPERHSHLQIEVSFFKDNDNTTPSNLAKTNRRERSRSLLSLFKDKITLCHATRRRGIWKTREVSRFWFRLHMFLNSKDFEGSCSSACADICNHQPCRTDYQVDADNESCECVTDNPIFECQQNANCQAQALDDGTQQSQCVCAEGFEGNPYTGCNDIDDCTRLNIDCGENGECVDDGINSYACVCDVGYELNTTTNTCELQPPLEICGGFAGFQCTDPTQYVCIDDPRDDCNPTTGGADCIGLCQPLKGPNICGGLEDLECPVNFVCVDDPRDDCFVGPLEVPGSSNNCLGICYRLADPVLCGGIDNIECAKGDRCAYESEDNRSSEVLGRCENDPFYCGGKQNRKCPDNYECVDEAFDDCYPSRGDTGCEGFCVPTLDSYQCGGTTGVFCPEEFVCVDNPRDSCEPSEGDIGCEGTCAYKDMVCGGIHRLECPSNHICVDRFGDGCNPNEGHTDCLGTCARDDRICGGPDGWDCLNDHLCVDNPLDDCDPNAGDGNCVGMCVPKTMYCGGIEPLPCPVNFECVDYPGDLCNPSVGAVIGSCRGVCLPDLGIRSLCGGETGLSCPNGYFCVDLPGDRCDPARGGTDCLGVCFPVL